MRHRPDMQRDHQGRRAAGCGIAAQILSAAPRKTAKARSLATRNAGLAPKGMPASNIAE